MSEADEVATNLRPMFQAVFTPANRNMDNARRYVREWMEGETHQVIDNVAEALVRMEQRDNAARVHAKAAVKAGD